MSEYQYYEFLAIDRPLTADEMEELRALSTRATITPVSFTNEYNWGDFKGDPHKLMQRHFDAHVHVVNWMTAIFMVRLPIEALSQETAKAAAVPYLLDQCPAKGRNQFNSETIAGGQRAAGRTVHPGPVRILAARLTDG